MRSFTILSILAILQPVLSLSLLVPLYIYPGDGVTAWQPLFTAIAKYPTVLFEIIVNPNSGPGSTTYPDSNYIAGVAKLNGYKNTKLIGYVDTSYTKKSAANVTTEINLYAGWKSYTASNISLSGIFFDDGLVDNSTASLNYLKTVSTAAYKAFPKPLGKTVFNPGTRTNGSYFQYVDTILEFEDPLSSFNGLSTIATFQQAHLTQDAIVIHDAMPTAARIKSFVANCKSKNIGFVYMTSDCCYNAFNGTLLNGLAAQIAAA